jgi:hypothetical protein
MGCAPLRFIYNIHITYQKKKKLFLLWELARRRENSYFDPLLSTKSPYLQLTSCIRTTLFNFAFSVALLTISSSARGLSSSNKLGAWISSKRDFFLTSTFPNTSLFQHFKSSFIHLKLICQDKTKSTKTMVGIPPLIHQVTKAFCFQKHKLSVSRPTM